MRERQLNVRLPDQTLQLVTLLCAHRGCSRAHLIERLIDDAAQVAKAEIAARQPLTLPPADEIDADELDAEAFRRLKGPIDHIR